MNNRNLIDEHLNSSKPSGDGEKVSDVTNSSSSLLTKEEYEAIYEKFKRIDADPLQCVGFIPNSLIEKIKQNLETSGITFITGPILTGKTILLNVLRENSNNENNLFVKIPSKKLTLRSKKITSTRELYFYWFRAIADAIRTQLIAENGEIFDFPEELSKIIEDFDNFSSWITLRQPTQAPDLATFLIILAELKTKIDFKGEITVIFYLDNIHTYVEAEVFYRLKEEIIRLPKRMNEEFDLSVKILIASRYLPNILGKQRTVILVPNFSKEIIDEMSNLLKNEVGGNTKEEFDNLIYGKTSGYPWFVIRFFKIYLIKRIKGDKSQPVDLARLIFNQKNYWTMDTLLGEDETSEFLKNLYLLIGDNEDKNAEFKKFIALKSSTSNIPDNPLNPNDFLIRQSGFIKTDSASDTFEESECNILKDYYKTEVEKELK